MAKTRLNQFSNNFKYLQISSPVAVALAGTSLPLSLLLSAPLFLHTRLEVFQKMMMMMMMLMWMMLMTMMMIAMNCSSLQFCLKVFRMQTLLTFQSDTGFCTHSYILRKYFSETLNSAFFPSTQMIFCHQ